MALDELVAALPPDTVLTDPDMLASYRQCWSKDPEAGTPLAVVRANDTADVQAVLRWASANRVPESVKERVTMVVHMLEMLTLPRFFQPLPASPCIPQIRNNLQIRLKVADDSKECVAVRFLFARWFDLLVNLCVDEERRGLLLWYCC